MSKQNKPEERLVSTKPLKYGRAMIEAAKKAQFQPKMVAMSSNVKDERK